MLSLVLFAGSIGLTVVFYFLGLPFFFMFLFIPVIPLLGKPKKIKYCPLCGWATSGDELYCPYDGEALIAKGN
ncbi:hypothetical protein F1737_05565 [Methanoplanus sp. FWC-SCC4]|uniref:Uncharacterized protein n=1 Tax=Methanochimaera problematica TaxID=2609417 RepID=A0AA97FC92_9EURY|nr:hypothetical protein [Methanoplanus sp. FWC-SCC4]WOF16212.1 hypothetical protein F1737_05565 [Methanoplanus sp. FWC-SCC4]